MQRKSKKEKEQGEKEILSDNDDEDKS